jgi:hypothetical protein
MNKELAREVALQIRKDPAYWNQGTWWQNASMTDSFDPTMAAGELLSRQCGSSGCAAGWTIALSYPNAVLRGSTFIINDLTFSIPVEARSLLELTPVQGEWLFDGDRIIDEVLWGLENERGDWAPWGIR